MASGAAVNVNANLNFNPQSLNAAGKQVQSAFGNINLPTKQVNAFNNSLGRITGQASEFDKSINAATARVFAFGAAVSIINAISQAFKGLISSTIEVEKRLTEINTILGGTSSQLVAFRNTIFDVAKGTGQSFTTVADAAAELARQGLSAEETTKRLNSALVLTRISGLDSAKSVEALTAAINGFTSAGLTAEQIVNKLVAVDTAFAVSAQDLAEGFSRAGATAEDAGVSFDELLGLITSVQQTTARGGAVIGNAFKSIFSRLSRGTVIQDLQELGVQIDQSQNGIQKLQALSAALDGITDQTKANAIKELAGGVYQINVVSAALKDLSSETSIFASASQTAASATDEAFKRNAELNKTLAAQINQLIQGLTNLGAKIGEITIAPVIEKIINGANKLIEILDKTFDPEEGNKFIQGFFKGIGNFLSGPGLVIISAGFFKLFQLVAKFAKEGIADLFKIGSQQEKIKNIEGGIVALLQQDANLRAILLSSSSSQAQKEQAVINAIRQQNALLTQQQALVNSIATAAAKAGVGGFSPTGGFTNKKGTGKFAAEFKQEEAMAKGLGASSSVKAKFGKGTIDGQRFIMNNEEIEIPRFNGGRDSAVIPTYAKGFVPNYVKQRATKGQFTDDLALFKEGKISRASMVKVHGKEAMDKAVGAVSGETKKKQDALAKQQKKELAKLGSAENPLDLSPESQNYAFLVPSINFKGEINKEKPEALKSWNSIPNLHFFVSSPIRGPQQVEIEQIPDETDSDNQLSRDVFNDMVNHSVAYARSLTNPLMDLANKQSDAELRTSIGKRLGEGGNKGAWGAVLSAAGAAFEAAVAEGLGIKEDPNIDGGDFDVKSMASHPKVAELFGLGSGIISSDFKVRKSSSTLSSFGKKILNDNASGFLKKLEKTNKTKEQPKQNAAGFIPNFNSLNKGIPVSQIRAHFDETGNPIAVTNTRDEPNGLKDAIKREKQGVGMHSSGFVPNFAVAQTGGGLNMGSSIGKIFAITQVLGLLESSFSGLSDKTKEEIEARDAIVSQLNEEKSKGKPNQKVISELESELSLIESSIEEANAEAEKVSSRFATLSTILSAGSFALDAVKAKAPQEEKLKEKVEGFIFPAEAEADAKKDDPKKTDTQKTTLRDGTELTRKKTGASKAGFSASKKISAGGKDFLRTEQIISKNLSKVRYKSLGPTVSKGIGGALKGLGPKFFAGGLTKALGVAFGPVGFLATTIGSLVAPAIAEGIAKRTGAAAELERDRPETEARTAWMEANLAAKQAARGLKALEGEASKLASEIASGKAATVNVSRSITGKTDSVVSFRNKTAATGEEAQNRQLKTFQDIALESSQLTKAFKSGKGQQTLVSELNDVNSTYKQQTDNLEKSISSDQRLLNSTFKEEIGNLMSESLDGGLISKDAKFDFNSGQITSLNNTLERLANLDTQDPDFAKKQKQELTTAGIGLYNLRQAGTDPSISEDQRQVNQELINKYEEAIANYAKNQTSIFENFTQQQAQLQLNNIQQQKAVLDNFISNFNQSFGANLDSFSQATSAVGSANVSGIAAGFNRAGLGKGRAYSKYGDRGTSEQTAQNRMDAIQSVNQSFEGAGFDEIIGQEDAAKFRQNLFGQIGSGKEVTALQSGAIDPAIKKVDQKIRGLSGDSAAAFSDLATQPVNQFIDQVIAQAEQQGDLGTLQKFQGFQKQIQQGGLTPELIKQVLGFDLDKTKLSDASQTALQQSQIQTIGGVNTLAGAAGGGVSQALQTQQNLEKQTDELTKKFQGLANAIDTEFATKLPEITTTVTTSFDEANKKLAQLNTSIDNSTEELRKLTLAASRARDELETIKAKRTGETGTPEGTGP